MPARIALHPLSLSLPRATLLFFLAFREFVPSAMQTEGNNAAHTAAVFSSTVSAPNNDAGISFRRFFLLELATLLTIPRVQSIRYR